MAEKMIYIRISCDKRPNSSNGNRNDNNRRATLGNLKIDDGARSTAAACRLSVCGCETNLEQSVLIAVMNSAQPTTIAAESVLKRNQCFSVETLTNTDARTYFIQFHPLRESVLAREEVGVGESEIQLCTQGHSFAGR